MNTKRTTLISKIAVNKRILPTPLIICTNRLFPLITCTPVRTYRSQVSIVNDEGTTRVHISMIRRHISTPDVPAPKYVAFCILGCYQGITLLSRCIELYLAINKIHCNYHIRSILPKQLSRNRSNIDISRVKLRPLDKTKFSITYGGCIK